MGTHGTIQIIGEESEKDKILSYIKSGFMEVRRIENLLSHYACDSEVSILNKNGFIEKPSADLIYLLNKCKYFFELSEGLFDITIQSLLERANDGFTENIELTKRLKNVHDLINFNHVEFDENRVVFKKSGVKITFGGIAKGYAVDRAIEVLRRIGVCSALVDIGGDIKTISKNHIWTVGVKNPFKKDEIITKIRIRNQAIATSGNYERVHIVRPDGLPINVASVTIVTENAVDADALATIGVLMGKEILPIVENLPNTEALIIMNNGEEIRTPNFNALEE